MLVLKTATNPGASLWLQENSGESTLLSGLTALSEDVTTAAAANIVPYAASTVVAKTIVFTAPVDMTMQYLVFASNVFGEANLLTILSPVINHAYNLVIGSFTIAGTGPDVGARLTGAGVPAGAFSDMNLERMPQLNWRMAAGDTLSLTCYNQTSLSSENQIEYDAKLYYTEGYVTSAVPKRLIGVPTTADFVTTVNGGVAATGSLTVTAGPLAVGDTLLLRNFAASSTRSAGFGTSVGTVTNPAGGTLTGVGVPRTPGDDDFDATIVGVAAQRNEILAALNDAANSWVGTNAATDDFYNFTSSGGDSITIERVLLGSLGNTDQLVATTVPPGGITVSGAVLTGGTSPLVTATMAVPLVDQTVTHIFGLSYLGAASYPVIARFGVPAYIESLLVNGTPAALPSIYLPSDPGRFGFINGSVAVEAGDTLAITARSPIGPNYMLWLIIAE